MNSLILNIGADTTLANDLFEEASSLQFIDDASFEFVGGGMAANGI